MARHRPVPLRRAGVAVAAVVLLVAGCGSDDEGESPSTQAGPTGSAGAAGTIAPIPVDDLPDPCTLFAANELVSLAGGDPGSGAGQSSSDPARRTCTFDSGLVLVVQGAADWDAVVDDARGSSGADALEAVAGVGDEAFWDEAGRQFLAVDDRHAVGVGGVRSRGAGEVLAVALLDVL